MSKRRLLTVLIMVLALATPSAGVAFAQTPTPTDTSTPTPTGTLVPEACHPVALAISLFFDLECEDIEALHDSGVGFGVIGRAYLTALATKDTEEELTPEEVLAMHQSGMGWGQIMKEIGVHPGGKGLGGIMSGRLDSPQATPTPDGEDESSGTGASGAGNEVKPGRGNPFRQGGGGPGNSGNAPGHNKGNKPGRGGRP